MYPRGLKAVAFFSLPRREVVRGRGKSAADLLDEYRVLTLPQHRTILNIGIRTTLKNDTVIVLV